MIEEASLPAALFPGLLERTGIEHNVVALAQVYGILLGRALSSSAYRSRSLRPAIADTLEWKQRSPSLCCWIDS